MSSVPQWNADIVTPEAPEAEAEIQANGGLEKDAQGALGVKVDGDTVTINAEGELQASVGTVDQTYDPTSSNAQSGTAVAGALATVSKYNIFKARYAPGTTPTINTNSKVLFYWKDTDSVDNIWVFCFGHDLSNAFNSDVNLYSIVECIKTSHISSTLSMFKNCTGLTTVPAFDTSGVTNISQMFSGCSSLSSVPLFDTSSATNMNSMFYNCTAVESGALALYTQASTQATPPSSHSNTFTNCGSGTTTGAAELAQIPTSWGGTGA